MISERSVQVQSFTVELKIRTCGVALERLRVIPNVIGCEKLKYDNVRSVLLYVVSKRQNLLRGSVAFHPEVEDLNATAKAAR